ncbi:hypothetical protein Q4S25_12590 [Morganella morganii]
MNFKNQAYEDLVRDLISDAFYLESRSNRGKISTIRQYAEVVIRKLIDLPQNEKMTLGEYDIVKKLKDKTANDRQIMGALRKLQKLGNKCTHTNTLGPISDDDVKSAIDALFNLYAGLFILYFKKHTFGSNNEVVSVFSILPPIIRYIVLDNLYVIDKSNLLVIDKLCLVLLKAFDKDNAMRWIDERKEDLSNTLPYTEKAIAEIEATCGKNYAEQVVANAPKNMYVCCLERLEEVSKIIEQKGLLYNNFEQAKPLYLKKGILDANTPENIEFNDIMEFVYLGLKVDDNENLKNLHQYNTLI